MCAEAVPSTFSANSSSATETTVPELQLRDLVGKQRGGPDPLTITPAESARDMELAGVGEERGSGNNVSTEPQLLAPGESVSVGGLGSSDVREEGGGGGLSSSKSHLDAVKRLNAMLLQLDRKDRDALKLRASQLER